MAALEESVEIIAAADGASPAEAVGDEAEATAQHQSGQPQLGHAQAGLAPNLPALVGEKLQGCLEALLFASGEPLALDRILSLTGATPEDLEAALVVLGNKYAHESSGLQLVKVAGGYQIRSDAAYSLYIRALKEAKPRRLSQAALETLAIVAYRQPIVKSDIDAIRGVDVAPTLKTLLERGLVRILGHQATVGQPALYGTTEEFLKLFGIESLAQLPTLRDVQELEREPGEGQTESEGTTEGEGPGGGAQGAAVTA